MRDDIKKLVEASKTNLSFGSIESSSNYPLVNTSKLVKTRYEGDNWVKYTGVITIFDRWPEGCETWDGAKEKSYETLKGYEERVQQILHILTSNKFNFKYRWGKESRQVQSDTWKYTWYPHSITEHKLIAVSAEGSLARIERFKCCLDEWDLTEFIKPPGG